MKRIFLAFAMLVLSIAAHAQAPQAVCYQAVATDQTGHELVSQNIKVRLSILRGSSSGSEEWVETHAVTTDGFGLFDLQIGNGIRTGGAQTSLSNIRWGTDKYFLKVEMDITGGNNYSLMGTNQLVSVPYALYSEKSYSAIFADSSGKAGRAANADFAATAGLATRATLADSAIAAGRASTALTANRALLADSATAASRATTAIRAISADSAAKAGVASRADSARVATTAYRAIVADSAVKASIASRAILADSASRAGVASRADSARVATTAYRAIFADSASRAGVASRAIVADSAGRAGIASKAILADSASRAGVASRADSAKVATTAYRAILADSASRAGTASKADSAKVATTAVRAITADSAIRAATAGRADTARVALIAANDLDGDPTNEIQSLIFRNDSLILTKPTGAPSVVQLSTQPFRAPGASIEYPIGILGDAVTITTNYVVPNGKSLYISAVNDGVKMSDGKVLYAEPGMPIIPEGYRISECYCTGILLPNTPEVIPLILDFTSPTFEYTVPAGFTLIIKSGKTTRGLLDLQIDSDTYSFYTVTSQSPRLIVITSGKKVKKPITLLPYDQLYLTGYLLKR
jgi:hypothetical protein